MAVITDSDAHVIDGALDVVASFAGNALHRSY